MVNAHDKLGLREEPMLLMEFHGSPAGVKEQAETVQELASDTAATPSNGPARPRSARGCGRRGTTPTFAACSRAPAAARSPPTPACRSRGLADCLLDSVAEADASGIPYFLVGHVGDGNFHFGYLLDPNMPEERETAEKLNHALVQRALAAGRHLHRRARRRPAQDGLPGDEAGAGAVDMMRTIKRALDPKNIMNPGKIFSL